MSRTPSRHLAAALLASPLPALACLAPSPAFSASGNSHVLHATTVPAAACVVSWRSRDLGDFEAGWNFFGDDSGQYFVVDSVTASGSVFKYMILGCPLSEPVLLGEILIEA